MKFAITVGMPHSGKSLFAKSLEGYIIIDTNVIRTAIIGEPLEYNYSAPVESFVRQSAVIMCKHYLSLGCDVIIDDENLTRDSRAVWYDISKEFKTPLDIYWVNTPQSICQKANECWGSLPSKAFDSKADSFQYPTYRESKQIKWIYLTRCEFKYDELQLSGKISKL